MTRFNNGAYSMEETVNITHYKTYESDYTDRGGQRLGMVMFCGVELPYPLGTLYIVHVEGTGTKYSPTSGKWIYEDWEAANSKYESAVASMERMAKRYIRAERIDMTREPDAVPLPFGLEA